MMVALALYLLAAASCSAHRIVLPWMCLERCGGNSSSIASALDDIEHHSTISSAVAFEKYNLGANSQLVLNNLTDVEIPLRQAGI